MHEILQQVLAAFTLLVTVKVALDVAFSGEEQVDNAAAILATGSILSASLLLMPWPQ